MPGRGMTRSRFAALRRAEGAARQIVQHTLLDQNHREIGDAADQVSIRIATNTMAVLAWPSPNASR